MVSMETIIVSLETIVKLIYPKGLARMPSLPGIFKICRTGPVLLGGKLAKSSKSIASPPAPGGDRVSPAPW
jgi:hypothetical protein